MLSVVGRQVGITLAAGHDTLAPYIRAIVDTTGLPPDDPAVINLAKGYRKAAIGMIEALRGGHGNANWFIKKGKVFEIAYGHTDRFGDLEDD